MNELGKTGKTIRRGIAGFGAVTGLGYLGQKYPGLFEPTHQIKDLTPPT